MLRNLSWALLAVGALSAAACSSSEKSEDKSTTDGDANAAGDAGAAGDEGDAGKPGAGEDDDPTDAPVGDGVVDLEEGEPISAPDLTWTYVELEGSKCRDGKTTGIGISINPDSDKLVIFMQGGGACLETITCAGNPSSWGESSLGSGPSEAPLQREGASPFADWNMVFVPYCSGDVHTGTNPSGFNGNPHTGYTNFTKALERVVPTFKDKVDTVVLAGQSAGGFGVAWNWMRTQDAFGEIPVHAFDDSGQPLGPDYLSPCLQKFVAKQWGWAPTIHPSCESCDIDNGNVVRPLVDTALNRHPDRRFALMSNDEDGVIKTFFAYGLNDCSSLNSGGFSLPQAYPMGKFPEGLDELRERLAPFDNAAIFEIVGGGHVLTGTENAWGTTAGGVSLLDWSKWFLADDAKWVSVGP